MLWLAPGQGELETNFLVRDIMALDWSGVIAETGRMSQLQLWGEAHLARELEELKVP